MEIRNTTAEALFKALDIVNANFDDNVKFKRFDCTGGTRQGGNKHNVTLTVASSRGKGAKLATPSNSTTGNRRHVAAACYHVHGVFVANVLELSKGASIVTAFSDKPIRVHGDNWQDRNVGSVLYPARASELCECGKGE